MLKRRGRVPALLVFLITAMPAGVQAQDQDTRAAILVLKAEIQRLRSDLAALQARVSQQEQIIVQTPGGVQIGNGTTRRLALVTTTGSAVFDRDVFTITGRTIAIASDRGIEIRSDTITLNARVLNAKGDGNVVLRGTKIGGN